MGTPGVPWKAPKSVILECIKNRKGVVTHICADLHIAYDTYAKHIKNDPELKEAIDTARNDYETTLCDMAETALMRALNQKDDLSAAISSAKFVLNNRGRKRGYTPPTVNDSKDLEILGVLNGIKNLSGDSGSKATGKSEMAPE